ncbi:MAG: ABC transporter permease [Bacteroidales bacterium]|nr:ABC transporter permease [Bacteroidales bacterium]
MKSFIKFLSRHKLYTSIEAVGLAVSMAFVILIGSYVAQQYEVAHETPDYKRTFVLCGDGVTGLTYWDKEELETNIPEVEVATVVSALWQPTIMVNNEKFSCSAMETDKNFFSIFPQYRLVDGSLDDFVAKSDVLISQSFARRIFPDDENVVGKTIHIEALMMSAEGPKDLTIKGVFADFGYSFFMPQDIITHISSSWMATSGKSFGSIGSYSTIYRVHPDADLDATEAKVKELLHKNYDKTWTADRVNAWGPIRIDEVFFMNTIMALTRNGNKQMVQLLTIVVLLLLLSAIFNYVNLNLALIGKRAKEMATRRLLGSDRSAILGKYIAESICFTAVCFVAALLLAWAFAPMMSELVSTGEQTYHTMGHGDSDVHLTFLITPAYITAYVVGIVIIGIICGLLPAFVASQYQPIDIIRGTLRRRNKMVLSRVFIVVQNVFAVFLIAMSMVMEVQSNHMLTRPTGVASDNLYYMYSGSINVTRSDLFKDKLQQLPFVKRIGFAQGMPSKMYTTLGLNLDGEKNINMPILICDTTYFRMLNFNIVEDFNRPLENSLWMSETAYNTATAVDSLAKFAEYIYFNGVKTEGLGGVVSNFLATNVSTDQSNDNGSIIIAKTEEILFANYILIETTSEDEAFAEQILKTYSDCYAEMLGTPATSNDCGYMRDMIRNQLVPVLRTVRLVELFAVLSVIISLLGLLAMSTYFAGENTKQIAIRKVFGSDVTRETWRNVKSYMMLSAIACFIGIPLAIYAARLYLERFAYRTDDYAWTFVAAIVISIAIAFATVLWQTLKAAKANPAEELKKE